MNYNSTLAQELEELINKALDTSVLPYVKGKSIRIGHIIVRETRVGFFLVFDTKENKEISKMFCKTSAVAMAKSLAKGTDKRTTIKDLDNIIEKNYNDAIFFKNTMHTSKSDVTKGVASARYEVAAARTRDAKHKLDMFIYV